MRDKGTKNPTNMVFILSLGRKVFHKLSFRLNKKERKKKRKSNDEVENEILRSLAKGDV